MRSNQLGLWLVSLALLGACGDDSDGEGGACGKTGCGGEVAGNWQVSEVCGLDSLTESIEIEQCPELTIDTSGITMTGPVSFEAGGAYTLMATMSGSMSMKWPASCLQMGGVQITCEQLDMAVMAGMGMEMSPTISGISCTGSNGCTCKAEMTPVEITESGTYVVSGSSLTMTDGAGEETVNEFCVDGDTLTLSSTSETGTNLDLVLKKR